MQQQNDNDTSSRSAQPAPLEEWLTTPQGTYVLDWELARIDQVVADIFGYFAVQIGLPGIDFLRASRVTTRRTAALGTGAQVVADAHELPFETESLDLVVLPHLLEFSDEPHQILREVERVLRPEGQLVVLAFNPVSLWGVKRLFTRSANPPWNAEFVSVLRMKDWLKLLNFEMRGGRFGRYRPPFASEKWLGRLGFLEHAGDRWWPVAGAVYLMQAKKRVPGMRLITPSWRRARLKSEALAPTVNWGKRWRRAPRRASSGAHGNGIRAGRRLQHPRRVRRARLTHAGKTGSMTEARRGSARTVVIYTDGACKGNPGPGGWGAYLTSGAMEKELFGGQSATTNNRMELTAVIEALNALKKPCQVIVYTDSSYVQQGIKTWIHNWKARGWKTADKKPVKNEDLWRALDSA